MIEQTGNNVSPRGFSELPGDLWEAFDALPPPLRHYAHEASADWCPLQMAETLKSELRTGRNEDWIIKRIMLDYQDAEMEVIAEFGSYHQQAHGYALPHMAANATVQRYGQAAGRPVRTGEAPGA